MNEHYIWITFAGFIVSGSVSVYWLAYLTTYSQIQAKVLEQPSAFSRLYRTAITWLDQLDRNTVLRQQLEAIRFPYSAGQVIATQLLSAVVIGILLTWGVGLPDWVGVLGALYIPVYAKRIILSRYQQRYRNRFLQRFPQALTMLSNGMRAGLNFTQAVERSGTMIGGPVGMEFGLVTYQIKSGIPMHTALENMDKRLNLVDVRDFLSAIRLASQVGGNMPNLVQQFSHLLSDRARALASHRAQLSQFQFTAKLLPAIPVVLLLLFRVFLPHLIDPLFETYSGWGLLAFFVSMQLLGAYRIRKITQSIQPEEV